VVDEQHGDLMVGRMRRPARLGAKHAAMYRDASGARSYRNRPPYPDQTIDVLAELVPAACRRVLDVGTGTGSIARPLAAHVDWVDALDFSAAMLAVGRHLAGGDGSNLRWIVGSAAEGVGA